MIIHTIRATFAPNRTTLAMEHVSKVYAYCKKEDLIPPQTMLVRPRYGDTNSYVWIAQYSSISEMEQFRNKRRADSGFMALLKEGTEADWYLGTRSNIYDAIE